MAAKSDRNDNLDTILDKTSVAYDSKLPPILHDTHTALNQPLKPTYIDTWAYVNIHSLIFTFNSELAI